MSAVVVQERVYRVDVRPPRRVEIALTVQTARAGDRTVAVVSERRVETVALRGPTAVVREPAIRVVEIPRTVIGSAAVTVQDEGVPVGTRPTLNFQGAGVTASDDAANNRVNVVIPGGGGGGGGHTIKEDGTALPQRSGLNFVAGIVASDDAANDETDVNLDYGGTAELADVAATEAAGTSNKVPRADHVHAHGSGYLPDAHHAQVHAHDGADGSGTVSHASLTGVTADQHHARAHDHSQAADGNVVDPGSRLHAPRKTDPASPVVGEIWLNGALLKYRDNQATPATQTVQKRGDVITDAEHGSRGAGLHADSHAQSHAIDAADHTGTLDIGDSQFPAPPAGYPQDVAATESDGTSVRPARADHVHAHGSGYLPDAHHPQAHSDADHTGANKVAVQDEGTLVGTRATLNFTGAGVTASDDAANNRVVINIPGGGGGGGGPHDHTSADGSGVLTGDEHDSFSEYYGLGTPPAAPSTGRSRLYARSRTTPGNWQAPEWVDELNRKWPLLQDFPVEAFGAVGDGTTDDTAAIQAAIDAARNAGGGTVVFDAKTYRITSALLLGGAGDEQAVGIRLAGKGYKSIIRQDTAGQHGIRARPRPRPANYNARGGAPTTPHIGIVIENLHLVSGVDWTQQGKPTAGVAIYLSSSRMVFIHKVWIDGYPDYLTKRWAGGIWFDDVDPANLPCRHTSVVGFFIQSIGDDTEYAGDADGNTYPNRKVGHTGILLRMVNSGMDGASAWGHNFVNGIVQTEHATDSREYYVNGTNAPGYRGFLNKGSDGTHFMNVEFIDFVKIAEWNADTDFSPWGLSNSRYESCSFEVPGQGQAAGIFRGAISQHEFWGCNFYGSGDPTFSGASYGIDVDCYVACELRFLECLFSAHAEGPDSSYAAQQAIRIANTYGQGWADRAPKFSNCTITIHGNVYKNIPHGIRATTSNIENVAIVGCVFFGLNTAVRISESILISNNKNWLIVNNLFLDCTTSLSSASVQQTNTGHVVVGNTTTAPATLTASFTDTPSNTLMLNSVPTLNYYRLRSQVAGAGLLTGRANLALLAEDSLGKVYPYYTWITKTTYTTQNTTQTLTSFNFSGLAEQSGFFRYTVVLSGLNTGVYRIMGAYKWNGTTLFLVGTLLKNEWENLAALDATVSVSGTQLLFQVTPAGENPTTAEGYVELFPVVRNP